MKAKTTEARRAESRERTELRLHMLYVHKWSLAWVSWFEKNSDLGLEHEIAHQRGEDHD